MYFLSDANNFCYFEDKWCAFQLSVILQKDKHDTSGQYICCFSTICDCIQKYTLLYCSFHRSCLEYLLVTKAQCKTLLPRALQIYKLTLCTWTDSFTRIHGFQTAKKTGSWVPKQKAGVVPLWYVFSIAPLGTYKEHFIFSQRCSLHQQRQRTLYE